MRVDVERVRAIRAELKAINDQDLASIEFYEDGKKLEFDATEIEDWKYTGLSNVNFLEDKSTGGGTVHTLIGYRK